MLRFESLRHRVAARRVLRWFVWGMVWTTAGALAQLVRAQPLPEAFPAPSSVVSHPEFPPDASASSGSRAAPTLLFMTDFGVRDDAVAICKGVMLGIAPDLRIIDLTHQVTPFDIREGAFYLAQTAPHYPSGTVFVGVVDPGVGTERRAIVLQTERGQLFVGPDNGLLSLVAMEQGVAGIWQATNPEVMLPSPSATFHGRDIFAPCGAWLASGRPPGEVGPKVEQMITLDIEPPRREDDRLVGEVMMLDKAYGNVWTNLPRSLVDDLRASIPPGRDGSTSSTSAPVRLEAKFSPANTGEAAEGARLVVPLVATFGSVREGAELAYFNSRDQLSFAVNMGDFASVHGVSPGNKVEIRIARP